MKPSRNLFWLLFAILLPLQGCAGIYSAKSVEGWVVDGETRQPMEGVNVVAHWAVQFGLEGGQRADIKLMEAVTDQDGRYYFPAWGPEAAPSNIPWSAHMSFHNPGIVFFKSGGGYEPKGVSNEITGPRTKGGTMESEWNGKTIELKRFKGSMQLYSSMVGGLARVVGFGNCGWKKIPRMVVALDREAELLRQQKIHSLIPTIREIERLSSDQCGSVRESLRGYMK